MRRYRAARSSRHRQTVLTEHLQRLQDARTQSARLRVVDELAQAFGGRSGAIGETFHGLLAESRRRSNHRQQLRLLNDYISVLVAAADCSASTAEVLNVTYREIEDAANLNVDAACDIADGINGADESDEGSGC
ncbi:hypothetical protein GC176_00100 [bacterium]|nr:hypothetical protein [bacterium]